MLDVRPRALVPLVLLVASCTLFTGCGIGPTDQLRGQAIGAAASSSDDGQLQDAFCAQAPALLSDIAQESAGATADKDDALARLDRIADQLDSLPPPSGVAPQWQQFTDDVRDLRDLVAKADPTDVAANSGYTDDLLRLQRALVTDGDAIDEWGSANC